MASVNYDRENPGFDDVGVEAPYSLDGAGKQPPQMRPNSSPAPRADLSALAGQYGIKPGETDAQNLAGKNPEDVSKYLADLEAQYKLRAGPTNHRTVDSQSAAGNALYGSGTGNASNIPGGPMGAQAFSGANNPRAGLDMPGFQFDDPYTNLFEQTLRNQLGRSQGSSEMDRLMKIIADQIEQLGTPGYSPQEMALLNTQAFEPIEDLRGQTQRNVLQRASARGVMPSSGIVADEANEADRYYDKLRTTANRDLSINALNRRTQDQNRAVQLAQLGLQVPNMQGQQAIDVASQLYQLPRTAMQDSLQVINGSSPQSSIGALIQLMQLQQNQNQFNSGNSAALWANIGQILAGLA